VLGSPRGGKKEKLKKLQGGEERKGMVPAKEKSRLNNCKDISKF